MDELPQIPISVPGVLLRQIGLRTIAFIRERTLKGIDADGALFHPYSTTPFARPYGGITQRTKANLGDRLQVFTNPKSGKLWAVIEGGYEEYKRAAYPSDSGVNLTATGAMLRALTIVSVDEGTNTVVIGFARAEEAEKALYHDQIGAGPRRVIRHFMGVSPSEREELGKLGAAGLRVSL
jgi:hypothetical protein